jgi:hypothetical protein
VKTQITSLHLTFSDDSTFKDILRFICDEELLRVKAIVWNILPNVRKDALLTKQARLINLFKPKDIWHNVIIVCKQSRNPEDDAQVTKYIKYSTGKSLTEALIFASTNPQYDDRLFIELQGQCMKIPSSEHGENMLCREIVFDIQNNFCTQHVLPKFCKKKSF